MKIFNGILFLIISLILSVNVAIAGGEVCTEKRLAMKLNGDIYELNFWKEQVFKTTWGFKRKIEVDYPGKEVRLYEFNSDGSTSLIKTGKRKSCTQMPIQYSSEGFAIFWDHDLDGDNDPIELCTCGE